MGDNQMIRDNLAHIDRLGLCHRRKDVCAVCKKPFYRTTDHVYKHSRFGQDLYTCSWTCYRIMDNRLTQERKERPKKKLPAQTIAQMNEKRIEECKAKIRQYTEEINAAPKGTPQRRRAQGLASKWRKKLESEEMKGEKIK